MIVFQTTPLRRRIESLFRRANRSRLVTMLLIMAFQGLCGHIAINIYTQQIMQSSVFLQGPGFYGMIVDGVGIVATVLAGLSVERFGRILLCVTGGCVQVRFALITPNLHYFLSKMFNMR